MTRWTRILTVEQYTAGLNAIEEQITPIQKKLLIEQYKAPEREVTSSSLAETLKIEGGFRVVNAMYGKLGRLFCEATGEGPDVRQSGPNKGKQRLWAVWSVGRNGNDSYIWQMLPNVALALEQVGWVTPRHGTSSSTPDAGAYASAFRSVQGMTDRHFQILRAHYHAPSRTLNAKQIAGIIGLQNYPGVNSLYGRLARLIGEQLSYSPEPQRLGTLVTFEKRRGVWHWLMRPEVAESLELLGWVGGTQVMMPEELEALTGPIYEGAVYRISVNAFERDPEARRLCIASHGTNCCICGFSFEANYGPVAEGFIHVHHLRPLSEVGSRHAINPTEDMRPVCPNCHAVLHRRVPAYSIDEVRLFRNERPLVPTLPRGNESAAAPAALT